MKKHGIAVRTAVVLGLATVALATFAGDARALPRGLYSVGSAAGTTAERLRTCASPRPCTYGVSATCTDAAAGAS